MEKVVSNLIAEPESESIDNQKFDYGAIESIREMAADEKNAKFLSKI